MAGQPIGVNIWAVVIWQV